MKFIAHSKLPKTTSYLIIARKPIGRRVATIRHDWVSSQVWTFFLTLRGWRVDLKKI